MNIHEVTDLDVIYKITWGSRAYGTNTPDSDIDLRGVYLPSLSECLSIREPKDIRQENGMTDLVIYPLKKFISLAAKCNPSVLEWLFVPFDMVMAMTDPGKRLREQRHLFLSKEIHPRFKGYAYSEFSSLTKLTGPTGEKRKKQILKFGYSPKNAMNCIRLMQQGIEMLTTGGLSLPRPNASELLEIKRGEWGYQKITSRFSDLLDDLDRAGECSKLPEKTSFKVMDDLMVSIIKEYANE